MARLTPVALVTLALLLLEHCTTVTLTRITQQRIDHPRPNPTLLVLLSEILKLFISIWLELTCCFGFGSSSNSMSLSRAVCHSAHDTGRMGVPAILYTVQNLAIYMALGNLEVSWQAMLGMSPCHESWPVMQYASRLVQVVKFQVLYQTKLLLTAMFSTVVLNRRLSTRQWLALLALTIGVVMVELAQSTPDDARSASSTDGMETPTRQHPRVLNSAVGLGATLVAASLSSMAGVYFEAVVKAADGSPPSLWVRNVQLCLFTLPIAGLTAAIQRVVLWEAVVYLDTISMLLVVLNASGGLIVAAVIKYGDNILKNFTTACSVILGSLISIVLFDFKISSQVCLDARMTPYIACSQHHFVVPTPG